MRRSAILVAALAAATLAAAPASASAPERWADAVGAQRDLGAAQTALALGETERSRALVARADTTLSAIAPLLPAPLRRELRAALAQARTAAGGDARALARARATAWTTPAPCRPDRSRGRRRRTVTRPRLASGCSCASSAPPRASPAPGPTPRSPSAPSRAARHGRKWRRGRFATICSTPTRPNCASPSPTPSGPPGAASRRGSRKRRHSRTDTRRSSSRATGASAAGRRQRTRARARRGWSGRRGSARRGVGRRLQSTTSSACSKASAPRRSHPAEQARRAGQLDRFLRLVPIEYDRGVEGTRVTLAFEIQEAISFRDAVAAALADISPELLARDPAATRELTAIVAALGVDPRRGGGGPGSACRSRPGPNRPRPRAHRRSLSRHVEGGRIRRRLRGHRRLARPPRGRREGRELGPRRAGSPGGVRDLRARS